jgi:hypothetical protein
METAVYDTIDELGSGPLADMDAGLDFSFGLLRAVERSLWGGMSVRYAAVEQVGRPVAFTPVYLGSNLDFNALLPRLAGSVYRSMIAAFGQAAGYRAAIAGSLISDRGWIPMRHGCDRGAALQLLLAQIELLARGSGAHFVCIKDIHQDFPDMVAFETAGYAKTWSLPTVTVPCRFDSFEAYLNALTKNSRKHARKTNRKANGKFTVRTIQDYGPLIETIYPLFRATFLKAAYHFEELTPRFLYECSRLRHPHTEVMLCEHDGRIAGAMLVLFDSCEQLNKRIGLDYSCEETALVYNLLMYEGLRRAIERGVPLVLLGQSTYTPKLRMGGVLEDEYLLLKPLHALFRLSIPLQTAWMRRYQSGRVLARMEKEST